MWPYRTHRTLAGFLARYDPFADRTSTQIPLAERIERGASCAWPDLQDSL